MAESNIPGNPDPPVTGEIDDPYFPEIHSPIRLDVIAGDYRAFASDWAHRSVSIEAAYDYTDEVFESLSSLLLPETETEAEAEEEEEEELPVRELTEEEVRERELDVCSVCTEKFFAKEKMSELSCGHYYHKDCILPWFRTRNTCPLCRHNFRSTL